jgi:hypothetical protein
MTKEEILAMEAGRELNYLVAKHIFNMDNTDYIPYSENISAAWEVVEKIGQNKFKVEILRSSDGKYFATCKKVGSVSDKLFEVYAKADTAPEAICKAALLAVMEDNQ